MITTESFSVVTPSYNAIRWIRSCIASVADQTGVEVHHIVQDGCSKDGTAEYLLQDSRVDAQSARDEGMYDAINKGWARCQGDYVLHLNADEQLLPGALERVGNFFRDHPDVDVVIGGTIICNPDGTMRFYRKALRPPLGILLTSHHPVQSCAIFMRRSSFADRKWLYDPGFRLISDVLLMIDIVREKKKIGLLQDYTSVFLVTGENISLSKSENTYKEYAHQMSLAASWRTRMRHLIKINFQLRKLLSGRYRQGALRYELYVPGQEHRRTSFEVLKPSGIYRED